MAPFQPATPAVYVEVEALNCCGAPPTSSVAKLPAHASVSASTQVTNISVASPVRDSFSCFGPDPAAERKMSVSMAE